MGRSDCLGSAAKVGFELGDFFSLGLSGIAYRMLLQERELLISIRFLTLRD